MVRYFGAHVSVSGGLENAIGNAKTLDVNAIQIHPSPPQRWNLKPYPADYEDAFLRARESSPVEKVFFHAIYLINLATPDPLKLEKAKNSLKHTSSFMVQTGKTLWKWLSPWIHYPMSLFS